MAQRNIVSLNELQVAELLVKSNHDKKVKVGISGFGRIGKLVFRIIEEMRHQKNGKIEVVAINCPSITSENLKYLINYDSVHQPSNFDIEIFDQYIIVNKHTIKLFRERDPSKIKWDEAGVEYVIDSTGAFKTKEKAAKHFTSNNVKKVLITAPSTDIPMYVIGVNGTSYDHNEKIVSNSSCTTNCLGPIAKVIDNYVGIEKGFITTVHAITSSQNTLDGRASKNIRIGRSCHNIIPSTTGATSSLGLILPSLKNKIQGLSYRVPTNNVSIIDFSFVTKKNTTYKNIINNLTLASNTTLKGILRCSNEELVSSDFIHDSHSCIVDIKLGKEIGNNFFKIVAWYDNEWGYSNRVVDLLKVIAL